MDAMNPTDASGGIIAWLEERSAAALSDAKAHPTGSGNRNFYAAQAIAYENALSAALASAPPAPTPDAGSDLAKLSAAATQGLLEERQFSSDLRVGRYTVAMSNPQGDGNGVADRAFIRALWNTYRSGRLVEASASPPPGEDLAGQGEREFAFSRGPLHRAVIKQMRQEAGTGLDKPYDPVRGWMAEGCRSSMSPCSHQQQDPTTICAHCDGRKDAPVPDLAGQGEPVADTCFDDVVTIARRAYERGKDGFIRSCRAADEWYTDADAHARGLMSVASDLRDVFLNPEYYGRAAPAPSRPADREEVAQALWDFRYGALPESEWASAKRRAHDIPDGAAAGNVAQAYAAADAILALRDAPRDAGDGTQAARDVLAERRRQVEGERFSHYRDDGYAHRELARAAACYARQAGQPQHFDAGDIPYGFPWPAAWWKPTDPRRDLVKAGALILAEIERLDRASDQVAEN